MSYKTYISINWIITAQARVSQIRLEVFTDFYALDSCEAVGFHRSELSSCDVEQQLVVCCGRYWATYLSHLQQSRCLRALDSLLLSCGTETLSGNVGHYQLTLHNIAGGRRPQFVTEWLNYTRVILVVNNPYARWQLSPKTVRTTNINMAVVRNCKVKMTLALFNLRLLNNVRH